MWNTLSNGTHFMYQVCPPDPPGLPEESLDVVDDSVVDLPGPELGDEAVGTEAAAVGLGGGPLDRLLFIREE